MNPNRPELLQQTTPEILNQLRKMINRSHHSALGTIETGSGHPQVSRAAIATDNTGSPVLLTSALAAHTSALVADGRCSLLISETGKGDLMVLPRATLTCVASRLPVSQREIMRALFLAHNPKAKIYIDLPDFGFWQLLVLRISFNAGFGKAYAISGEEYLLKT